jgi:hypothetical protein
VSEDFTKQFAAMVGSRPDQTEDHPEEDPVKPEKQTEPAPSLNAAELSLLGTGRKRAADRELIRLVHPGSALSGQTPHSATLAAVTGSSRGRATRCAARRFLAASSSGSPRRSSG